MDATDGLIVETREHPLPVATAEGERTRESTGKRRDGEYTQIRVFERLPVEHVGQHIFGQLGGKIRPLRSGNETFNALEVVFVERRETQLLGNVLALILFIGRKTLIERIEIAVLNCVPSFLL